MAACTAPQSFGRVGAAPHATTAAAFGVPSSCAASSRPSRRCSVPIRRFPCTAAAAYASSTDRLKLRDAHCRAPGPPPAAVVEAMARAAVASSPGDLFMVAQSHCPAVVPAVAGGRRASSEASSESSGRSRARRRCSVPRSAALCCAAKRRDRRRAERALGLQGSEMEEAIIDVRPSRHRRLVGDDSKTDC